MMPTFNLSMSEGTCKTVTSRYTTVISDTHQIPDYILDQDYEVEIDDVRDGGHLQDADSDDDDEVYRWELKQAMKESKESTSTKVPTGSSSTSIKVLGTSSTSIKVLPEKSTSSNVLGVGSTSSKVLPTESTADAVIERLVLDTDSPVEYVQNSDMETSSSSAS